MVNNFICFEPRCPPVFQKKKMHEKYSYKLAHKRTVAIAKKKKNPHSLPKHTHRVV